MCVCVADASPTELSSQSQNRTEQFGMNNMGIDDKTECKINGAGLLKIKRETQTQTKMNECITIIHEL